MAHRIHCMWPRCGFIFVNYKGRNKYCPYHTKIRLANIKRKNETNKRGFHKKTTGQRGYDGAWIKCRRLFLIKYPDCKICGDPAKQVHHKVKIKDDPSLRLKWSNLESLCTYCHGQMHRKENENDLHKLKK